MVFTIVTVCYNAVEDIEDTIRSVVGQTSMSSVDYVIVDGGSTDGTTDIICKYRSHLGYYASEPDRGIYDAMNKGIAVSKGDYVLFLNAGDVLKDSKVIEEVGKRVRSVTSRYDIIYGDVIYKYAFGEKYVPAQALSRIKYDMVFSHQSAFVRTEVLRKRHFNTQYRLAADYDFLLWAYISRLSFCHIDLPVSVIDAVGGATYGNFVKSRRESCEIQCANGGNRCLCYGWYLWKISRFKITSTIKDRFPHRLLRMLVAKEHD